MRITVECRECGKTFKADIAQLIKTMVDCAEHGSIYGGFMCEYCAEANHADEDGEENEVF